jgi:hypothetical protein
MKALIRGKNYDLTEEELDFVKQIYGYWEEKDGVYIFGEVKIIPMSSLTKTLGVTKQALFDRNKRNPQKYVLHRLGPVTYIYDWELPNWEIKLNKKENGNK